MRTMAADGTRDESTAERCERTLAVRGPEPAFDDQGVDLTQIRTALARTPDERLSHLEASANSLRWLLKAAHAPRTDVDAV
jgi:hypothetical protein